jgi:hypothetical protein
VVIENSSEIQIWKSATKPFFWGDSDISTSDSKQILSEKLIQMQKVNPTNTFV